MVIGIIAIGSTLKKLFISNLGAKGWERNRSLVIFYSKICLRDGWVLITHLRALAGLLWFWTDFVYVQYYANFTLPMFSIHNVNNSREKRKVPPYSSSHSLPCVRWTHATLDTCLLFIWEHHQLSHGWWWWHPQIWWPTFWYCNG